MIKVGDRVAPFDKMAYSGVVKEIKSENKTKKQQFYDLFEKISKQ